MRFFLVIMIAAFRICNAQVAWPDSILPSTRGIERNPLKLVNALTAGKNSEKEKFDAIFMWVTTNIRYDYGKYFAPTGSPAPRVQKILKTKRGICIDYAYLMDTLCRIAGIRNVSVYGYAKDDLFDVNDSLFIDNHAWNAVKLDNYWYVYDPTWSAGTYRWDLTRFSKKVIAWRKKLWSKRKDRIKTFEIKRVTECDSVKQEYKLAVPHLALRYRILLQILGRFKLKAKPYFFRNPRPWFYLMEPEVMAITHFPDNPYWSLTKTAESVKSFERDSSYYHLSVSTYTQQKRGGRFCSGCDNYYSLDHMQKEQQMKWNSYSFNPRNRFVTWESDFNIATIYFSKAIPENDSLTKVSLLDSSLLYLAYSRNDLQQCMLGVYKETEEQRAKNTNKDHDLYMENKAHGDFIRAMIRQTYNETHHIDNFSKRVDGFIRKMRMQQARLKEMEKKGERKHHDNIQQDKIKELESKLEHNIRLRDSLEDAISGDKNYFEITLKSLSENIMQKASLGDSLGRIFLKGANLRKFLFDNYKKLIAEERKKIEPFKKEYAADMNEKIYIPSDSCSEKGERIFEMIAKQNKLFNEELKLENELAAYGEEKYGSFKSRIKFQKDHTTAQVCWIAGNTSLISAVLNGYKRLKGEQEWIRDMMRVESRAEYERFKVINAEIYRRKRKFRSVPINNSRLTSGYRNFVLKYKRDYLKKLKAERRAQRKKAGKVKT